MPAIAEHDVAEDDQAPAVPQHLHGQVDRASRPPLEIQIRFLYETGCKVGADVPNRNQFQIAIGRRQDVEGTRCGILSLARWFWSRTGAKPERSLGQAGSGIV